MAESTPSNSQPRNIRSGKNQTKQPGGAYCTLTRITDATYLRRAKRSYALTEQFVYECYYADPPEDRLNLAQYYTGLRCLLGKPSNLYDDWKGSFAFVFQVDIFRKEHIYAYLLHIMHFRGGIEFSFRKIVASPESHAPFGLQIYHEPLEDEFSGQEMATVECFMYGFLQGYLKVIQKHEMLDAPDFVLLSESNHIISGYIDSNFFEQQSETEEDFEAEKNLFQDLIRKPAAKWPDDSKRPTVLTIKLEPAEDSSANT